MEGKKANIHQVIRKVILHVRKQERNVSTTELDESWRLIEKQIHATKKKKSTHFSFIILQKKISSANWVNRTKEIVAFKKEKKEGKRDILSRSF